MKSNLDQELELLSPMLKKYRDEDDGLKTPGYYFAGFDEKLAERLAKPGVRRHSLQELNKPVKRRLWPGIPGLAASVALIVCAIVYFNQNTAPAEQVNSELTPEDIELYLMENAADFEPEQLAVITEAPTHSGQSAVTAPATEITEKEEIPAEVVEKLMEEMTDAELADLL